MSDADNEDEIVFVFHFCGSVGKENGKFIPFQIERISSVFISVSERWN